MWVTFDIHDLSCKGGETLETMLKVNFLPACLSAALAFGTIGLIRAQSPELDRGVTSVAMHHNISVDEVLASDERREEACLLGTAMRVIQEPGKNVPEFQELPGGSDLSVESRLLMSTFRPVAGQFTWLRTVEGWFVVIPSKERFEVLLDRAQFPQQ